MQTPRSSSIFGLDLNLLRTFMLIVEEKSLTRAAERLAVKQPSVSAALQRLEDALGCTLIIRGSRRFELTRHGEVLFRECLLIFRSIARIGERLAGAERDITGTVRILSVTDVRYRPFDEALVVLHARFPSIRVQIDTVSSQDGARAVARQVAPAALCLLSKPIAGLSCRYLIREEFGIFCGPSHPLWQRSDVDLETLRDQDYVSFYCTSSGGYLEPLNTLGAGLGLDLNVRGTSAHLREVVRMVSAGIGIGVLPVESVRHETKEETLWQFPLPTVSLGADLYLVTNPTMTLELAEATFLQILESQIRDG